MRTLGSLDDDELSDKNQALETPAAWVFATGRLIQRPYHQEEHDHCVVHLDRVSGQLHSSRQETCCRNDVLDLRYDKSFAAMTAAAA